jgi:hypothetical protein
MARCSVQRRVVGISVLLSCLFCLGAAPAQAQEALGQGWVDALVHGITQWLPTNWWSGDRSKVQGSPERQRGTAPGRVPRRGVPVVTTACYSGATDPDGCPGG